MNLIIFLPFWVTSNPCRLKFCEPRIDRCRGDGPPPSILGGSGRIPGEGEDQRNDTRLGCADRDEHS